MPHLGNMMSICRRRSSAYTSQQRELYSRLQQNSKEKRQALVAISGSKFPHPRQRRTNQSYRLPIMQTKNSRGPFCPNVTLVLHTCIKPSQHSTPRPPSPVSEERPCKRAASLLSSTPKTTPRLTTTCIPATKRHKEMTRKIWPPKNHQPPGKLPQNKTTQGKHRNRENTWPGWLHGPTATECNIVQHSARATHTQDTSSNKLHHLDQPKLKIARIDGTAP